MVKPISRTEALERMERAERRATLFEWALRDHVLGLLQGKVSRIDRETSLLVEIQLSRLEASHEGVALVIQTARQVPGVHRVPSVEAHYLNDLSQTRDELIRASVVGKDSEALTIARAIEDAFVLRSKVLAGRLGACT